MVKYAYDGWGNHETEANGDVYTTSADLRGNVRSVSRNGAVVLENTFDSDDRPLTSDDKATGYAITNTYDSLNRRVTATSQKTATCMLTGLEDVNELFSYDAYGNMSQRTVNGKTYTYGYEDTLERRLKSVTMPGDMTVSTRTDDLGRESEKIASANGQPVSGRYTYYRKCGDHATGLVSSVRYGHTVGGRYAVTDGEKYAYDAAGNVISVHENGLLKVRYAYDSLNRLVREDNRALGKTYLFAYDNNGNILSKVTADYTLSPVDEVTGTPVQYRYDGDKLIGLDGQTFTWDGGNPTSYKGKTLSWQNGRELASYDATTFAYDGRGRRVRKGSVYYTYTADGQLVRQSDGVEFLYDDAGISGIYYNNATYLYRKNIFGDIIAILDSTGSVVVKYTYDGWGNHETEDNSSINLGTVNPIRYRGYYYDIETGLYYLQTRYYDPAVGRFLSMDDVAYLDPETINGLNLYAYCLNNPLMRIDSAGTFSFLTVAAGLLFATFMGTMNGIAGAAINDRNIGVGAGVGALSGFLSGVFSFLGAFSPLFSVVGNMGVGGLSEFLNQKLNGEETDIGSIFYAIFTFGVSAFFGEAINFLTKHIADVALSFFYTPIISGIQSIIDSIIALFRGDKNKPNASHSGGTGGGFGGSGFGGGGGRSW